MLEAEEEWRPPLFPPRGNCWSGILARLRRFFDLQAGSIWNDLASLLAQASGLKGHPSCWGENTDCLRPASECG